MILSEHGLALEVIATDESWRIQTALCPVDYTHL